MNATRHYSIADFGKIVTISINGKFYFAELQDDGTARIKKPTFPIAGVKTEPIEVQ